MDCVGGTTGLIAKLTNRHSLEGLSSRASLQFPVGRIHRHLRKGNYAERIRAGAPVYLAAVMEYLVAEVLKLAGNELETNASLQHLWDLNIVSSSLIWLIKNQGHYLDTQPMSVEDSREMVSSSRFCSQFCTELRLPLRVNNMQSFYLNYMKMARKVLFDVLFHCAKQLTLVGQGSQDMGEKVSHTAEPLVSMGKGGRGLLKMH